MCGIVGCIGNEKANKFQTYPASLDSIFKSASIGQIVGPYTMQENVIISKVLGFTPTRLKARHLLIATNSSKDEKVIAAKRKTADSLLKVINTNNFTELVTKYTEDPGSKTTGGLYENFLEAEMVKEFGSFCATQAINKKQNDPFSINFVAPMAVQNFSKEQLALYPNPTKDAFYLQLDNSTWTVNVFDVFGKKVLTPLKVASSINKEKPIVKTKIEKTKNGDKF